MKQIYLDNAATTKIDSKVLEAMEPFLADSYANPSSFHMAGKRVRDAIDDARATVAKIIGAEPDEVLFTSGGTESDNLAVLGAARMYARKHDGPAHIVVSEIEHPAVLEPVLHFEQKEGGEVTRIRVDKEGIVSKDDVITAIQDNTALVSIMQANNEIGTVQPIRDIGNVIQKMRKSESAAYPLFHTDACQAAGALNINVSELHVDLMTLNGGKIHGPKGVGMLYVKRGVKIEPLQFGGSQEKAIRPGTENVAGIIGFAKALEIAQKEKDARNETIASLRDYLIEGALTRIPKTRLNGHKQHRLPNNVNISFLDIEGEALLLYLDAKGVFASTGSACTSASLDPSHVILALGMPYEVAHGSIRFSLSHETTKKDIDYVLEVLPPLVEKLRSISPVNVDEKHYG